MPATWPFVIHELATNALKYGALAAQDGFLTVSWHVDTDALDLTWQEKMARQEKGQQTAKGFGTQLIDAMVRDLKGDIQRTFDDAGFTCRIIVPLDEVTQSHSSS